MTETRLPIMINEPHLNMTEPNIQEPSPTEPGIWAFCKRTGAKVLSTMDLIGETVANILGITEPRYSLYIDDAIEYQKQVMLILINSKSFKKSK
jgi:hypothetical protein